MHAKFTNPRRLRAALVVITTVALMTLSRADAAGADAVVRQLSGTVEIGRGEPPVWTPLVAGTTVLPDERIRTGPDGRVELALEGATLRVHENSLLALPPATADAVEVDLEAGHSLFDVLRREGRRFEVHTPTVVVSVKGTRFGVEANEAAGVVSVYRGVVGVRSAEATDLVETLVREGFLATGGGEQPIDLDVIPAGDPWTSWQDFQARGTSPSNSAARESGLDRARTSLRHATDADVVKRAAARRPELAERLRQRAADSKPGAERERDAKETRGEPGPLPASPAVLEVLDGATNGRNAGEPGTDATSGLGLPVDTRDVQRDLVDLQRVDASMRSVESGVDVSSLTGGAPLTNGGTTLSTDHLSSFDPSEVVVLMDALQDLQAASDSLTRPWTESDMSTYLENQLTTQGIPLEQAQELIQGLFK